jgi:hypothetical protein
VHTANNLTAICEPIGILNISQPYRPPRPVTGIVSDRHSRWTHFELCLMKRICLRLLPVLWADVSPDPLSSQHMDTVIGTFHKKKSVALVRERTIPTERPPLVGEVSANVCGRGCHVVSVTDSYGRILGFSNRSILNFRKTFCFLYLELGKRRRAQYYTAHFLVFGALLHAA